MRMAMNYILIHPILPVVLVPI